jgi:hypothetical protein
LPLPTVSSNLDHAGLSWTYNISLTSILLNDPVFLLNKQSWASMSWLLIGVSWVLHNLICIYFKFLLCFSSFTTDKIIIMV